LMTRFSIKFWKSFSLFRTVELLFDQDVLASPFGLLLESKPLRVGRFSTQSNSRTPTLKEKVKFILIQSNLFAISNFTISFKFLLQV
jgi:hypothetical protein